jgi:secreted trypsin-like serine protease
MKMQGMSSLYFAECFHSSVVGGTEAAVGEFPSMVFLLCDIYLCGGTVIDKRTILTAGHCLEGDLSRRVSRHVKHLPSFRCSSRKDNSDLGSGESL